MLIFAIYTVVGRVHLPITCLHRVLSESLPIRTKGFDIKAIEWKAERSWAGHSVLASLVCSAPCKFLRGKRWLFFERGRFEAVRVGMALAGTGYKHSTLPGFHWTFSAHFERLEFLDDVLNVCGGGGRQKGSFFFISTPGCQSNTARKSAPIKRICQEFHDNVNTPLRQYRGKGKKNFFSLKK